MDVQKCHLGEQVSIHRGAVIHRNGNHFYSGADCERDGTVGESVADSIRKPLFKVSSLGKFTVPCPEWLQAPKN